MNGWGSGWWVLMPLLWVVLIAVIVWAVTQLFPGRSNHSQATYTSESRPNKPREAAEEILERRLAKGEIDIETYNATREALRTSRSGE